jgi:hypothetical protein
MLDKLEAFRSYLLDGNVEVHFDASEELMVPWDLQGEDQAVLEFGSDISDLTYNEVGISGTIQRKGYPYFAVLPWCCVYSIVGSDNTCMTWNEDLPKSIQPKKVVKLVLAKSKPDRSHLRLVR